MISALQYKFLCRFFPAPPAGMQGGAYNHRSKLEALLGPSVWEEIRDKDVIDFGCGEGAEAIEIAERGARRVFGLDIQEKLLEIARRKAVSGWVQFGTEAPWAADIIVSLDSFEHFASPDLVLEEMARLLKPGGKVLTSFGPTWYHPLGGHLFSVFPWAHLLFTEKALCQWRANFKFDGARKFSEVAGGLNQMTIRRFVRLVEKSPFALEQIELVPIRPLRPFHNRLTREFTTAVVRAKLVKRERHGV